MTEEMISFFNSLDKHPIVRVFMLIGGLLFFWILEGFIPLVPMFYKKTKIRHAGVNLSFTGMHLIIHSLLALVIVFLSDFCKSNEWGLVYWLHTDVWGTILVSFIILDFFGGWLVHITEHKIPFLWRFHVVHHADNNVDVSSGLRHHPAESLLRGGFFFMGIIVSGAPMYAVMIFQTLLIFATAFTHANIKLPGRWDEYISYLFVSPNMHKVHHHWKQPFTDCNYGAILAIWDRLLGTFLKLAPHKIKYGLDRYYPNQKDEDFLNLLTYPFKQAESTNKTTKDVIKKSG